jgi:methylglutaconyl-CoA hydratase
MGQRAARRYFTTAERFNAETALQLGLISEVTEDAELDNTVNRFVDALITNSPAAVKASKQLVFDVAEREISDELIADTCQRIASIRVSEEGQEGLSAFLQKRKASWINE